MEPISKVKFARRELGVAGGILRFADMPYPWFSPTVRANTHTSRLWQSMLCSWEMQKNERILIFLFPFLWTVCQCELDHSLMTDGYNPWRAKNPDQKFTKVHMRVCTDIACFWSVQLNTRVTPRVKEFGSSLKQFWVVELPSLIEV